MEKYWYVYKRWGGPPSFKHPDYNSAVREAERLVDAHGGEYEILESVALVSSAPKYLIRHFKETNDDSSIPF